MSSKKFLLSLLFIIITFSSFVPKAEAQGGFVWDLATVAEGVKKAAFDAANFAARRAATLAIERIVNSTITWAQSGFEGNPAYVTDPKGYFGNIADGVAGEFILGSDLGFLCSPFQANIRLSLAQQYYQPLPFQCTLTGVVGNIENFYTDFSSGGWDAWFSMTQTPTNNPYGAYIQAKIEMDSRIASAVGLQREQLLWDQGFLSWRGECQVTNPPQWIDRPGDGNTIPSRVLNPNHVPGKAVGECIDGLNGNPERTIKTPGSTIKAQLDRVLPASMDRLINTQSIDALIEAFAAGILRRYVFSSDGLFSRTGEAVPPIQGGGGPSGGVHYCPVPNGTPDLCQGVDSGGVLSILEKYSPTNEGITAALPEVQATYGGHVQILDHPERLDKLDFGGGLIVDVVIGAGGSNPSWGWIVECQCGSLGGEVVGGGTAPGTTTPPPGIITPPPSTNTPPPSFVSTPPNEIDTVNAIASGSAEWQGCLAGSGVACHRFVREVARELASRDPRWGLLTKNPGEQQCTMTQCGGLGGEGYGEDIIVYRMGDSTTSNLYIVDIVAGAGGSNPSTAWIAPQPQRQGNNWAPVP